MTFTGSVALAVLEEVVWVGLLVFHSMLLAVCNTLPMPHYSLAGLQVGRLLLLWRWLLQLLRLEHQQLQQLLLELVSCNIPPMLLYSLAVLQVEVSADPSSCSILPRPLCSQAGWQVVAAGAVLLVVVGRGQQEAVQGRGQEAAGNSVSNKQPRLHWGLWGLGVLQTEHAPLFYQETDCGWGREELAAAPTGDTGFPNLVEDIGVGEVAAEDPDVEELLLEVRVGKGQG